MRDKKYIMIIIAILFILPIHCYALNLSKEFSEYIGSEYYSNPTHFLITSYDDYGKVDGYIYVSEHMGNIKYSNDNKIVYKKSIEDIKPNNFNATVVLNTDDANVKGENDIKIEIKNAKGTVIYSKLYGGTGTEDIITYFNDYDANGNVTGYILLLSSSSEDLMKVSPGTIMLKFDLSGNIKYEKNIENVTSYSSGENRLKTIYHTENGSTYQYYYDWYSHTIKKEKIEGETQTIIDEVSCGELDYISNSYDNSGKKDGIIIVSGGTVIKYDYNLKKIKELKYDDKYIMMVIESVNETGVHDGINVVAITENTDQYYIIKCDYNFNEQWEKTFLTSEFEFSYYYISKNEKGKYDGYISLVYSNEKRCFIIKKYDLKLEKVWEDNITTASSPVNQHGNIYSIIESYDDTGKFNGYIFTVGTVNACRQRENLSDDFSSCGPYISIIKYTYKNYLIEKETSDEGIISVDEKAYPGDIVKVKVTPKEGYVLKRVVVIDESGKEIEVTDDGTFIMPEGKVTVTAIYNKITNPETVSACYIVLGIILLISVGTLIVNRQKAVKNN